MPQIHYALKKKYTLTTQGDYLFASLLFQEYFFDLVIRHCIRILIDILLSWLKCINTF